MAFKKKAGCNRGGIHDPASNHLSNAQGAHYPSSLLVETVFHVLVDSSVADAQSFGLLTPEEVRAAEREGYADWRCSDDDFLQVYLSGSRVFLVMGILTARTRHPAFLAFMNQLVGRG